MSSANVETGDALTLKPPVNLDTKPKVLNGSQNNNQIINNDNNYRVLTPKPCAGFDSLKEQCMRRIVKDGFGFNVMTLGETGVGKTTLIESLFKIAFPDVITRSHLASNVKLRCHDLELEERGITLKLGLIESIGFGDQINRDNSYKPIVEYIDEQFEKYFREEQKVERNLHLNDTRVHVCFYLISPVGHGLKAIDLMTMKELDSKTNLIPLIAKSDSLTKSELDIFRANIRSEIVSNDINIYHFPTDDEEIAVLNATNNALIPFAIVGSHDFVRVDKKDMRARQFAWGTVEIENENHCDFVRLRDMVLRINMEDLRETTHSRHYELYRRRRLQEKDFGKENVTIKSNSFQDTYGARRGAHLSALLRKEDEIIQRFELRIMEIEAEFEEKEKKLHLKYNQLKEENIEEMNRLEVMNKILDEEIFAFKAKKATAQSEDEGEGEGEADTKALSALSLN